ncbi:MAG: PPC domain-containing protein, partial [Verrucomicrobiota bacterium]
MRLLTFIFLIIAALAAPQLQAQLPTPTLDTIYPAGGKAGTTVDVVLTGTELDDLTELRFTNEGIKGEPVILPADEIWPEPRQDGLKIKVSIAENVPAGIYEARTIGATGTSTPRFFVVSGKGGPEEISVAGGNETPETATEIQLEQPVNAQTTASNSDHFKLNVKAGQRILVHLWGERIDSRIDATLTVLDPNGNLIADSLNEIGLDPLADFTAAADGDYMIKVADYLYNGGGLYYYRLLATTAPHIDGVFPLAGKAGSKQKFTIYGRNLPGGQPAPGAETKSGTLLQSKEVEIQVPGGPQAAPIDGSQALQLLADGFNWKDGISNNVRIGLAHDNVVVEDANLEEQTVTAPCEVAGRFDYGGDMDLYRFTAKKDEVFYIDVISNRIGINADPNVIIQQIIKSAPDAEDQSETTKFIAESDDLIMDSLQMAGGFSVQSRDPGIKFTAPADGEYRVIVGNNAGNSGALTAYRLGIRAPKAGFKLIAIGDKNLQEARNALPGVPILHGGSSTIVRVLASREDGFDGPIELSVEGLPADVYAPPAQIWEQNDEGYLVITASKHVADWTGEIKITGKAKDGDREIVATATPATVVWAAVDTQRNRVRSRLMSSYPLNVRSELANLALAPDEAKVWQVDLQQGLDIPVNLTIAEQLKGNAVVTPWGLPNFKRPAATNVAVAKP